MMKLAFPVSVGKYLPIVSVLGNLASLLPVHSIVVMIPLLIKYMHCHGSRKNNVLYTYIVVRFNKDQRVFPYLISCNARAERLTVL